MKFLSREEGFHYTVCYIICTVHPVGNIKMYLAGESIIRDFRLKIVVLAFAHVNGLVSLAKKKLFALLKKSIVIAVILMDPL